MKNQKNILSFFLEQQKKITNLKIKECSLFDKKRLADNYFSRNKAKINFQQKLEQKLENSIFKKKDNLSSVVIPHLIVDQEFCHLFQAKFEIQKNIQKEDIYCIFTSPLSEEWIEVISIKYEDSLIFRTGFFEQEYEIYDSILHGFDGMFVYCQGLDKYKIQYLTETARQYNFTIVFIIHNKYELQTLLDTDAPYLAISGYKAHNFELDTSVFFQLSNLIPKSANLMAWAGKLKNDKKKLLNDIGYKVIFEVC